MTYEPMSETELLALQKLWRSDLPPPDDFDAWAATQHITAANDATAKPPDRALCDQGSFSEGLGLPHHRRAPISLTRVVVWLALALAIVGFYYALWRVCRS
jgi:hypothetical protein